jgi:ABC-type sugar transport system ATPase subunit
LRDVSFQLYRGEALALLGDNGAGKSTLVKCIAGNHPPDSGTIIVDGVQRTLSSPHDARMLGIETVYQDLLLIDTLDVAANLFLNRERLRSGLPGLLWRWVDTRRMYRETAEILASLGIQVPSIRQPVERLSGGQRQAIAIGRAVAWGRHIVLMDEPAAALGVEQSALVLKLIRRLTDQGAAVLLITHNMEHVLRVTDRAMVLRHGRKVAELRTAEVNGEQLVGYITGALRTEVNRDEFGVLASADHYAVKEE